ncbi:hypothetical protein KC906_00210 [Candidatus Kaiserbacteria bacterium]|nr:hypothetical protein [Candidatus Kaiserbacteria bacterium]
MFKDALTQLFNAHGPPGFTPEEWQLMLALASNLSEDLRPYERRAYHVLAPQFGLDPNHAKRLERTAQLFFNIMRDDEDTWRAVRLFREPFDFHSPEWLAQDLLRYAKNNRKYQGEELTWDTLFNPNPAQSGSPL